MKRCPSEGELRAYLDGELAAGRIEELAAHQAGCTRCAALSRHLADRGARVSALLAALPPWAEPEPAARLVLPRSAGRRWAPAFALAACALLAVTYAYMSIPSRNSKGVQRTAPAQVAASLPEAPSGADPLVRGGPPGPPSSEQWVQGDPRRPGGPPHYAAAPARRARTGPRALRGAGLSLPSAGRVNPAPQLIKYFIALDNEPIEVGTVVRVLLGPSELPADVLYGPDGRARAIRLVSDRY